jgi:hypothetical protein
MSITLLVVHRKWLEGVPGRRSDSKTFLRVEGQISRDRERGHKPGDVTNACVTHTSPAPQSQVGNDDRVRFNLPTSLPLSTG